MTDIMGIHPLPKDVSLARGDLVKRVWGDGYLESQMRVSAVDEQFIYCDAQQGQDGIWVELPPGSDPWKFDRKYGVETDEEMGWGVKYGLLLSRLVL